MDLPIHFCSICNSRSFKDFNMRHNAQCCVCDSLERNRFFLLALLSVKGIGSKSIAIIQTSRSKSKYNTYIEKLFCIDFLTADDFKVSANKYDIVYHEHILHKPFLELNNYHNLINCIDKIINPGGLQLFSIAPLNKLGKLSERLIINGRVVTISSSDELEVIPNKPIIAAFDPTQLYGANIFESCLLGEYLPTKLSSNMVIFSRKPK